jgi:hypothetical protein
MKNHFEILNITRNNVLNSVKDLSLEELNIIPTGFKNNVIWNVAHIVATQQLLCYKLSGLDMSLDADFITKYMKGSFPESEVTQNEVDYILKQLKELPAKMESDYSNGIFKEYNSYTTSYNITLDSIEKAIQFNNVHEGLHFGYIMAMKKVVLK